MINEKDFVVFLSLGVLQTLRLPAAKCYTFHWDKDNFGRTLNPSQSHFFFCLGLIQTFVWLFWNYKHSKIDFQSL